MEALRKALDRTTTAVLNGTKRDRLRRYPSVLADTSRRQAKWTELFGSCMIRASRARDHRVGIVTERSGMDFGEVLTKAWQIVWRHKILWIFGIFAGCGRGGGGGGGGSGWSEGVDSGNAFGQGSARGMERFFDQAGHWIGDNLWILAVAILFVLVLAAVGIFLGNVGKIGLIHGTFRADGGAERLRFGALFKESLPYFWRVFLLSLLVGLAFLVIFLPLAIFGFVTAGVGFLCMLPLICLFIPVGIAVSLVIQQADAAMVIENLGIQAGVRRGWEIVKNNIGPVLLIWLITFLIGLVIGVVIALPVILTIVPAVIALAVSNGEFPTGALLAAGLCFVMYLPVLIVAQGILTAYVESVWALTFLRLSKRSDSHGKPEALPANA
jgi:hypothetical protein